MNTIRASSTDRIWACPPSAQAPEVAIGGNTLDRADLGTAFHECFAEAIHGREPDLDGLAARYTVDSDELSMLLGQARRVWTEIRDFFPDPETEVSMASGILTGTADLVAAAGGKMLAVLDHKSGWKIDGHENQLKSYGWLALQLDPQAEAVWCGVYHVRFRKLQHAVYSRDDLEAWYEQLQARLAETAYRPGDHCGYCPRAYSCPARADQLKAMSGVMLEQAWGQLPTDPIDLAEFLQLLREQADQVEKAGAAAKTFAKAVLESHGGELPTRDGRKLKIVRTEKSEIDARLALPLLEDRFEAAGKPGAIHDALTISKSALEKALGQIAPPKGKGKLVAQVLSELADAGAVAKVPFQERIEVVDE